MRFIESRDRTMERLVEQRISQMSKGDVFLYGGNLLQIENVSIHNELGQQKAPLDKPEEEDKVTLTVSICHSPDSTIAKAIKFKSGETTDLTFYRMIRKETEYTMLLLVEDD
jgi:hypothetical protein